MNLSIDEWKNYQVSKILNIFNGKGITKDEIEENQGDFTVVQSGEENNGVLGKIDLNYCKRLKYTLSEQECLTVARSGSAGFVSFQVHGCVVGDSAKILLLDDDIANTSRYVFIRTVLTSNRFKYAYGRKVTESKYMSDIIKLPTLKNEDGSYAIDDSKRFSDEGYIPDWKFMDKYISSLHHKPLTTSNREKGKISINTDKWKDFEFGRLIKKIYKAHAYVKDELEEIEIDNPNAIRYITRTAENNGCEMIVNKESLEYIEEENAITIGDTTATCFYQSESFVTGDHMVVIRADWLDEIVGIFITTILNKEQYKYSYGRAFIMDRIKDTIIKLPILRAKDGKPVIDNDLKYSDKGYVPDWNYMRIFLRSLPYGDRLN